MKFGPSKGKSQTHTRGSGSETRAEILAVVEKVGVGADNRQRMEGIAQNVEVRVGND